MTTNELRIGNWALYPHSIHEPFQITEPRHIELAYLLKPIPLSPEILEACGFEKTYDDDYFRDMPGNRRMYFYIEYNAITIKQKSNFVDIAEVKHLHQLQNLYFALTGSELSINLEKVKA